MATLAPSVFHAPYAPCLRSLFASSSSSSSSCAIFARGPLRCQQAHSESVSTEPYQAKDIAYRRHLLVSAAAACQMLVLARPAFCLLEADDDEELLEKVKEDRKKKIRKRGEVNAYKEEAASIQKAVYQLSRAGQALDKTDFSSASSVLGQTLDVDWVVDVKTALSKISSSAEEQSQADLFTSSMASLQVAVRKEDIESSKRAFVTSADALEKWSYLTGLADQLKGL